MKRSAILVVVVIAACQDGSAPVVTANPFGERVKIVGEAAGGDSAGRTASCWLDLILEMGAESRPAPGAVEFPGIMGGAVSRTVLEADSSGFGFFADVYWPTAVVRFGTGDLVDFVLGDPKPEDGRFWNEIALLRGTLDGGQASGTWTCAPFDIWENGYVDTILVVQGTWRTEPY